jgi:hypothetical protein
MLQIDHYQGAHGPVIWLEIDSAPDLARLRTIFRDLARGGAEEIELCSAIPSRVVNLRELRLRRDRGLLPRRRMRVVRSRSYERPAARSVAQLPPRPPAYVWSDTPAGWRRRAELVDALLRSRAAAHRDLTEEGVDGALVELSFRQAL